MMFRYNWEDLITPFFTDRLLTISNEEEVNGQDLIEPLAAIFQSTGGLALAQSNWSEEHRNLVAEKLLHESIKNLLRRRYHFQNTLSGYLFETDNEVITSPLIDINYVDRSTLIDLPVIGKELSQRIIEERRNSGYYSSSQDLADRVHGLGNKGVERLSGVLVFREEGRPIHPSLKGTLNADLKAALSLVSLVGSENNLLRLLEELSVFTASNPHPSSRFDIKRDDLEPDYFSPQIEISLQSNRVVPLPDNDYYPTIMTLLEQAQNSIDVCMFFIAKGNEDHPTSKLLDLIVQKKEQGVEVRILVDKDREDDPYGSRIINSRAAKFLAEQGVDVRADQTDVLLHSKFVILDNNIVVIGSHNWTAGSYFEYKDLSFVFEGTELVARLKSRFQLLWDNGSDF